MALFEEEVKAVVASCIPTHVSGRRGSWSRDTSFAPYFLPPGKQQCGAIRFAASFVGWDLIERDMICGS